MSFIRIIILPTIIWFLFFSNCLSQQMRKIEFNIPEMKDKMARIGYFYGSQVKYIDSNIFDKSGKVIFQENFQYQLRQVILM